MIKNTVILVLACSFVLCANAQKPEKNGCVFPNIPIDQTTIPLLKEINRDIWIPFTESWAKNDVAQYNAIHAEDFIRVTGGSSQNMHDRESYATHNRQRFASRKQKNERMLIDFTFFERIADETMASERGIYHVTRISATGEEFQSYGRFHCFHKKINDHWFIAVDYDSDEGGVVTEADFKAGKAMDVF
jgi:hypothetical protein